MEVNDFTDLNTTELFDDSNESFDENEEGNTSVNSVTNISDDDNPKTPYSPDSERNANMKDDIHSADAGTTSTDVTLDTKRTHKIEEVRLLNSMSVPTAVITPAIPSGLSIVQKCTKTQLSSGITGKSLVTDSASTLMKMRPTTVISKSIGMNEANSLNSDMPTTSGPMSSEPTIISLRPQVSQVSQKLSPMMNKGQLNSLAKYTKLHTALVSRMESSAINAPAKLVKIAPSNTTLTTTTTSDIKTSPVIIVQTPGQKLVPIGQKFTSLKILQKCPTPGSIVKQKILNLNEVRKLQSGASLKPLLLNSAASSNSISSTSPAPLIVLKPPVTSTTATVPQTSTSLQLKPQQLYQTVPTTHPTKPATISFVSTPKPSPIAIGTKLIPSKILTTVKHTNTSTDSIVAQLPVGLTKIPKETIVNKIATKDGIDFMRMMKANQSEKSIEPTVTIGQKQMSNQPPIEFQSLTTFLNSNDKSKSISVGTKKHVDHPKCLEISNGKVVEKMDEPSTTTTTTGRDIESITISNGKLSNPNGSIKILKSFTDPDVDMIDIEKSTDVDPTDDGKYLNKHLEKLNTSPRLQGRSKSLTITKQQSKVRRRYPSAGNTVSISTVDKLDDNVAVVDAWTTQNEGEHKDSKPDPIEEVDEPTAVKSIDATIENERTKNVGDSLECDEKIEDSDKSKSVSPDFAFPVNTRQLNTRTTTTSTTAAAAISLPTNISSSHVEHKNDDPLTYIKWRNGVGYLRFSNLQFSKNEFNLLEVLEMKETTKSKSAKISIKATEQPALDCQIIDLVEVKSDAGDNGSRSVIGRKKVESKQRFKRAGMNLLQNVFVWELYLRLMDAQAAPDNLFINPFPSSPNLFEVGMKMEAIDPEHCSLFCVCTVVEKLGYRIRLTFDGYGDKFSFWRNADSMDIFPPGWCAKTGRVLQPPLKYGTEPFDWHRYILKTNGRFAPRSNFTHLNSMTTRNPFKVGMKLEADHLKLGRGKVGVATICDVLDSRILLQFDGFDSTHDYWADITSPIIHPYNWYKTNNRRLVVAKDLERNFSWPHYLAATRSQPVPKEYFCPRPAIGFRKGMKLEIVDKKVPTLIRPCTVIQVADCNIQVLFDGWPSTYSYWIDEDHPDIHPINWCLKTEHPLEPPLNFGQEEFRSACGVLGCREVGNAKHFGVGFHYTIFECPYESRNWLSTDTKPDRLAEINKIQKVRKRRARQPITSGTESYQKIKLELLSSEENSLQNAPAPNEWNNLPTKIKNEEIEIGEIKLQTGTVKPPITTENSPTKLPKHIQVTESILRDYGPGLMHIHKLWKQNSKPVNIRRVAKNPMCWSVDEVADYVSRLPNCAKLGKLFREQEIDGDSFLKLSQNDLVDLLEIRMGPAVKIYNQIVSLRSDVCENYMD